MTQERTGLFTFWYPKILNEDLHHLSAEEHNVTHARIGLCDVRATDDLIVSYDYGRDGWKIEQETGLDNSDGSNERVEVAFIKSWANWKVGD